MNIEPFVKPSASQANHASIVKHGITIALLCLIVCAVLFVVTQCKLVVTEGPSMEPTFSPGDILFCVRSHTLPSTGDIVLLDHNGKLIVKRVAYTAGEEISADGWYDAGHTFVPSETMYWGSNTVPHGYIFVLGDNADNSHDSRYETFGLVPINSIWGTVVGGI